MFVVFDLFTCLPHKVEASHCPFFDVVTVRQAGGCEVQFKVLGSCRLGIELKIADSTADMNFIHLAPRSVDISQNFFFFFQNEERAKMALLIKTWRAKFEKAHAASRQHSDHIKTLELEIERLKEEKNT